VRGGNLTVLNSRELAMRDAPVVGDDSGENTKLLGSSELQATVSADVLRNNSIAQSLHPVMDEEHKLGQLPATAIAGNDITSSCLYAAGITMQAGGIYAPFSSTMICIMLYLFRDVYSEVCTALPMNGGTYNALLNTTSKNMAALAAVLSLLSYTATAVTSAASAAAYLHYEWNEIPALWVAIGILCFFAMLNLLGMSESANAAVGMFILHLTTMAVLIVTGIVFVIRDNGATLKASFHSSSTAADPYGNPIGNLYYGFCAAMLGVTGFETSANYIEEQKEGVFPKTLRNMWIGVTLLNPALVTLSMAVIPIENIVRESDFSLAAFAYRAGGPWLRTWVVIDATIVLAASVLTAYVGVGGLLRRMALDQILPSVFLRTNKWRGTNHVIILSFCAITCSLRFAVSDMDTLGGVYSIAFLGVMTLFTVSNLVLKAKRGKMKRAPITPTPKVIVAGLLVFAGMIGNMVRSVHNAEWFLVYFTGFASVVLGSIYRVKVLRAVARVIERPFPNAARSLQDSVMRIREQAMVYFTKTGDMTQLNKALQYVFANEDTQRVYIVWCKAPNPALPTPPGSDDDAAPAHHDNDDHHVDSVLEPSQTADSHGSVNSRPEQNSSVATTASPLSPARNRVKEEDRLRELEQACAVLDQLYPKVTVELVVIDAPFTPSVVTQVSETLHVPKNFMFIATPSVSLPSNIGEYGGLRVITY
jgi:amino acid transporter